MACPSKVIVPCVDFNIPSMVFSSVDLPAPFEPSRATISFASTDMVTP